MVDAFSTQVLNRVVDNLPDTTTFLSDMFFPEVNVSEEETIMYDTTQGRKLITPVVSPLAEAPIIADLGYTSDSFRPAYLKDKRRFDPRKGTKRTPGEAIGGTLTRQQRIDRAIKANLAEQVKMIGGRMEVWCAEVLRTGSLVVIGERYPARTVNFRRRSQNTVIKTGGLRWGEAGVSPWDDVDIESQELSDATGYQPTDVIFDPKAWKLFKASIPKDALDKTLNNLNMTEVAQGYVLQPRDGVVYRGQSGYLRFWTYTGTYTDPETGQTLRPLPDYSVLIGGASIDGVRHFGAIQDFDAGIQARQYFVKSKVEFDPSGIDFLMQSAPLPVPYRINNVKFMQVR